jgi:hypothetical protein
MKSYQPSAFSRQPLTDSTAIAHRDGAAGRHERKKLIADG